MRKTFFGAAVVLCGLTLTTFGLANSFGPQREKIAATQKRIAGVITAVDDSSVTITALNKIGSHNGVVWGRIDTSKTRIVIDGRVGRPSELRLTDSAKAELSLDEVWLTISVETR